MYTGGGSISPNEPISPKIAWAFEVFITNCFENVMNSYFKIEFLKSTFLIFLLIALGGVLNYTHFGI
jgi:hypothetical protein